MSVDHEANERSTIDVLDRLLYKGIIVDVWLRAADGGIDLTSAPVQLTIEGPERSIEEQLRKVRRRIEQRAFAPPHPQRRAEDRIREELHDAQARTIEAESTA
ncbi:MAG TPA: hypothetical protein VEU08_16590 [Vicinamibacterales bacterium]|nr:hypothetical protein [Vicinamibacterales bacterium]